MALLGFSVAFRASLVRWADERFAHRFAGAKVGQVQLLQPFLTFVKADVLLVSMSAWAPCWPTGVLALVTQRARVGTSRPAISDEAGAAA